MGEPSKVLLLDKVIEVIKRDNLLSIVQASGNKLKIEVKWICCFDISYLVGRQEIDGRTGGLVETFPATREKRARHWNFLRIWFEQCRETRRNSRQTQGKGYGGFCLFITNWIVDYFGAFLIGVQSGGCGDLSVRLRPALVFQPYHADIFLEKLEKVLKKIKTAWKS